MTRDGLTEENLRDGSVKDISHRSRGRPENKEEFVPERERKKAENEDSKSGKGKRLQMEKIRKSSVRQEAVEDTVEVTPEEKVSGYRKKLHRHEKIPDDDNNLNSQKKSIRKKQLQKQMTKEQAKAGRLSFDDEGNQMVKGAGMKPGGTAGKYIATQAVISGMKAVTSEEEETDENAGVESARLAERETEAALRGLRHAQIRSKRTDVKTHRRGYREATVEKKLKFGSAESMEGVKHAESVKNAEQKRHFYNRFFQKKRYKDAYRAARAGKSAGSLGGATTITGVENMTVKAKIALKEIIKRNRAMFAGIGIFALLFLVIAVSLGSCSASIEGAGSVIGITTYPSSDEDIYAAENRYAALESALNQQINEMERRHPNYDEYQYNIAEIGHNPYHLISYLTAKYGDWTYSDVENELQSLFEAQYQYLTEDMEQTARNVVRQIYEKYQLTGPFDQPEQPDVKKVMNNSKVTNHHAIIPTMELASSHLDELKSWEEKILFLIAVHTVMAMSKDHIYQETEIEVECQGEIFKAKGKIVLQDGWKLFENCFKNKNRMAIVDPDQEMKERMPKVTQGQTFYAVAAEKTEHFTSPPKPYSEDTLLAAMETAGNKEFDEDTEKKGLGTPATRAGIIEKLIYSQYATRKGKQILPTDDGKVLVEILPDFLKSASMTAEWENQLLLMEHGEIAPEQFMTGIKNMLTMMLNGCDAISEEETRRFQTRESIGTCSL